MNYFEFYNIPISFKVDTAALKKTFYRLSKEYHPDFYTQESEKKQAEILQLSSLNNEAYKTLSDFDTRMKYILDLKGALAEEGQNQIPQDFLMEMMEINEALMELEFDYAESVHQKVLTTVTELEKKLYHNITTIIENYDEQNSNSQELSTIKDYYLKKRYLLRIRENLSKFASH